MGNRKKPKTYNHYVPQFYLKNFSSNNSIGVYNFDRKEFVDEASIRKVGGRDYLYGNDSKLEDWFQNLEAQWALIIKNVLQTEKIPRDSTKYTYLLMFVYLSDVRGAEAADQFHNFKLQEGKNVAKILKEQGKLQLSEEDIDNLILEIDRPNLIYIQNMKEMISVISGLCPLLIINESSVNFITSDVPVAKYNKWFIEREYRHPCGFGHVGMQCFLPLSPKVCFCLYDDSVYNNQYGKKDRIRLYQEHAVMELNRMFIANAYSEIYYQKDTKEKLEQVVSEKKAIKNEDWSLGNPKIGYLQKISSRGIYEEIDLPIFKTYSFFRTAPFPYADKVGPLREEVYKLLDK